METRGRCGVMICTFFCLVALLSQDAMAGEASGPNGQPGIVLEGGKMLLGLGVMVVSVLVLWIVIVVAVWMLVHLVIPLGIGAVIFAILANWIPEWAAMIAGGFVSLGCMGASFSEGEGSCGDSSGGCGDWGGGSSSPSYTSFSSGTSCSPGQYSGP